VAIYMPARNYVLVQCISSVLSTSSCRALLLLLLLATIAAKFAAVYIAAASIFATVYLPWRIFLLHSGQLQVRLTVGVYNLSAADVRAAAAAPSIQPNVPCPTSHTSRRRTDRLLFIAIAVACLSRFNTARFV